MTNQRTLSYCHHGQLLNMGHIQYCYRRRRADDIDTKAWIVYAWRVYDTRSIG